MTPQEITAHALALGITPELYPEFWVELRFSRCPECEAIFHADVKFCNHHRHEVVRCFEHLERHCTLPSPLSDSPRCAIWDGFYMRALGLPCIVRGERTSLLQGQPPTTTKITNVDGRTYLTGSVTAALCAAFLAKGAKG